MRLQGTVKPDEIISLLDLGANTRKMRDHADHIHVGFSPRFGAGRTRSGQAMSVLKPGQWSDLLERLGEIALPEVDPRPSRYAIRAAARAGGRRGR